MNIIPLQSTSYDIWSQKYRLRDSRQNDIDKDLNSSYLRTATALAANEDNSKYWTEQFLYIMQTGATPAGRILSNAGTEKYKPSVSLINCTVSQIVEDSMEGILEANLKAGLTLKAGCGIGYEWSTLRPSHSFVAGSGANTSGPLSFMNIFDATCFTVMSAGGRRGAQMGTFAVWHPDVLDFIIAKRADGTLRQFNLSLLIDDEFMTAVKNDRDWKLIFPVMRKEKELGLLEEYETIWKDLFWEEEYCKSQGYTIENNKILCKVYKTIKATYLWDTIMSSTYDFAEPGILFIDRINKLNNNSFCETIRATNPLAI